MQKAVHNKAAFFMFYNEVINGLCVVSFYYFGRWNVYLSYHVEWFDICYM